MDGTGLFLFTVKDQKTGEPITLELPRTIHMEGTGQPLVSAHKVHALARKRGWSSGSFQDFDEGNLQIKTSDDIFDFGLRVENGLYVFKDVFETESLVENFSGKSSARAKL